MLRNQLVTAHEKHPDVSSGNGRAGRAAQLHDQNMEVSIDDLYINSRSGLRGLFFFLGVSVIALFYIEQSLTGSVTADVMEQLGSVPSVILINCVFGASTISSLICIAGKIYFGLEPGKTSIHLWFRVIFYLLYFISGLCLSR